MELRHLRYFVAVAEELHFTRAAARLNTAQPAISQHIRRLERELGTALFVRTNRSVDLTDAGRVFLDHARGLLDGVEEAQRAAVRAARGEIGRISIGFIPEAAVDLLPDLLVPYRRRHPHVEIALHELRSRDQVAALLDGRLHVGLLIDRSSEPRLDRRLLKRGQMMVALPAQHPLAGRRSVRLRELADESWIHPVDRASVLIAACAEAGFEPHIVQQASADDTRLALVAAGVGVALVGDWSAARSSRHIAYRPLTRPALTFDLVAAWRAGRPSQLVRDLLDAPRSAAAVTGKLIVHTTHPTRTAGPDRLLEAVQHQWSGHRGGAASAQVRRRYCRFTDGAAHVGAVHGWSVGWWRRALEDVAVVVAESPR